MLQRPQASAAFARERAKYTYERSYGQIFGGPMLTTEVGSSLRPIASKVVQAAVRRLVDRRTKPQRKRARIVVPFGLRSDSPNFWAFIDAFVRNEREPNENALRMAKEVLRTVRIYGDKAVIAFNERWGTSPSKVFRRVFGRGPSAEQLTDCDVKTLIGLKRRYDEAVDYHFAQLRTGDFFESQSGLRFKFGWGPPASVGICLPRVGKDSLVDLIMSCVPAQLSGAKAIYVSTPNSEVFNAPLFQACAVLCGIKAVYHMGCVQAVAAMAAGTEGVVKVDKILGSGGQFGQYAEWVVALAGRTEYVAIAPGRIIIADRCASAAAIGTEVMLHAERSQGAMCAVVTRSHRFGAEIRSHIGSIMRFGARFGRERASNIINVTCLTAADVRALAFKLNAPEVHMYLKEPLRLISQPKVTCFARTHPGFIAHGCSVSDVAVRTFVSWRPAKFDCDRKTVRAPYVVRTAKIGA
ncbi:MAG: histidinol dehydrogenase [Candidatus Hodgkinia cicadicola]